MADFSTSSAQNLQIALAISTDIKAFVETHEKDFQNYLQQENDQRNKKTKPTT